MSFTNILEGARQYFQGLPTTNSNRDGTPTQQVPTSQPSTQQIPTTTNQVPTQPYFPPPQSSSSTSTSSTDLRWTTNNKTQSAIPYPHPNTPQSHPNTPSSHPSTPQPQIHPNTPSPHLTSLPSHSNVPHSNTPHSHPSTPHSHPSTPQPHPSTPQPHPSTPQPHSSTPQPHPSTPHSHPSIPNSHSNTPNSHSGTPQSHSNPQHSNTPHSHPNSSHSHPNTPQPHPSIPQPHPSTPNYPQYNNLMPNPSSKSSSSTTAYPNTLYGNSQQNLKLNNHFNNYNHNIPSTSSSSTNKNVLVNSLQHYKQNPYMFNNARINTSTVFEGTNHSGTKSTTQQQRSTSSSSSTNQHHESSTRNLLNMDRQNYNRNQHNLINPNSRPLAPSSTHQQYPTISTMDRAFAQQYANSKLLQQQQQPTTTNNSTRISSNNVDNISHHNSIPNSSTTRHSTISSTPYTIPQQYNTATTSTKTSTSSKLSTSQQQQHHYNQQQLRQHLLNNSNQQQQSSSSSSSSSSSKLSQQYSKLQQQYQTSTQYQQYSNSQASFQAQTPQTQTSNYPTMANPASWFAQMSQQQYRNTPQQQYQQQRSQSSSTTTGSHHSLPQSTPGDLSLAKSHSSLMKQHEHHGAQLLQPPKAPVPQRQKSGPRKDSPLDLSVRTIRRSADSTLDDEVSSLTRAALEMARTPTQFPDSSAPTPPRLISSGPTEQAKQEISLPNLLKSSEAILPSFRPAFKHGSHSSDVGKPRSSSRDSSLLSLEQKFGPRVSAPAETLSQAPISSYQQPQHREPSSQSPHISQYQSHREHAMPHLAAHAMAHSMQYQRHPKPINTAADKRVLSILRNSLEVRNAQQQKLLAASEGLSGTYRLQVPRAMDSASPQFLREARQQSEATHSSRPSHHHPQPPIVHPNMPHLHPQHQHHSHPHPLQQGAHSQGGSELDGLAAFLAARIRTKAELKQCGDTSQTLTTQQKLPRRDGVPSTSCNCEGPCTCSTRPKCRCDGPNCTCGLQSRAAPVTSRKASETRSSTETSVFDFPDSDPEMAPASVGDLRRNRKPPSTDTQQVCTDGLHCPAVPSTAPVPPAAPAVEEDPMWASVCDSFVTSLETRGAKTSRAGHSFIVAQKRKMSEKEEGNKIRKTEIEIESDDEEEEIEIEIKQEPKQCKEEMKLIETCLKATSECGKLLEIVPPNIKPKVESESESEEDKISKSESEQDSDSEGSVCLAIRQEQLLLASSSESEAESSDSDWSDDVGRAVVTRLQPRSTRNRGRGYNITTRLRSTQSSVTPEKIPKRPGRPRRKIKSPSPDDDESRDKSESPKPCTRRTRQRSPSPMVRRTRQSKSPVISSKKSKSPLRNSKRNKSKSPTRSNSPVTRRSRKKSKSPIRKSTKKSKSPEIKSTKKSKSPEVKTKKSKSPEINIRKRSKTPEIKTRRKSKSPEIKSKRKSKSPVSLRGRKASKSPVSVRGRKASKSPVSLRGRKASKSPVSLRGRKASKSPPTLQRQTSRKDSPVDQGFYPGWESELIKFKQSLRMPSNLISIHSRPNSDPPTPTKKRRGCTNSPMSVVSDPGVSGSLRTLAARKFLRDHDSDGCNSPLNKPKIRDVELSDSSNSLPGRPRRNVENCKTLQDRKELLTKLANKLKGRAGVRGRKKKEVIEEIKKQELLDEANKVPLRQGLRKRRRSSRLSGTNSAGRILRSAALQRSTRALNNSMKQLRLRDLKASEVPVVITTVKTGAKRGPKGKRKLRSSGFDYLRKKKKKKDNNEPKKPMIVAPVKIASSIEEIANEVRCWVVNKGLGETIIHRAARLAHDDMLAYCLETLDMEPSPRDNAGYTPLHESAVRGHLSTSRLLLMYGAKVDASAQGGIRPIHEAADCGHTEVIRLLLSYGSDPQLATYCGQTPADITTDVDVKELLDNHLADVQGHKASLWTVEPYWGPDTEMRNQMIGYNELACAPSPPSILTEEGSSDVEEAMAPIISNNGQSSMSFPATWWLPEDPEPYMLLPEVCTHVAHPSEWIKKNVRGGEVIIKEMPKSEFLETVKCCHILGADWKPETMKFLNSNSVTLIQYDENIKKLLLTSGPKHKNLR